MLSQYISLERRYSRSINLERDLDVPDSVLGYVPTTRSIDMLERFMSSFITPRSVRAWTVTGIYGSGKSSFAHFLASLCAPNTDDIQQCPVRFLHVTREQFDHRNHTNWRGRFYN